jgi:hypothetical protein
MKTPYKVFEVDGLSPKDLQAKMNRLSREGYHIVGTNSCRWIDGYLQVHNVKVLICRKTGKK